MDDREKKYNLGERTARFGEDIIGFANGLPRTPVSTPLIVQLVRAGTSVGANYCEADNAFTKKDFIYKIGICKKECFECGYWLRMLSKAMDGRHPVREVLGDEARQLSLIFSTIIKSCKLNSQ